MIAHLLGQLLVEVARRAIGPVARRATRELFLTLLVTFVTLLAVEAVWKGSVDPFISVTVLLVVTAIVGFAAVLLEVRASRLAEAAYAQVKPLPWLLMAFAPAISAVLVWGLTRTQVPRPYVWAVAAGIVTFLIIYVTQRQLAGRPTSSSSPRSDVAFGGDPSAPEGGSVQEQGSGDNLLAFTGRGLTGAGQPVAALAMIWSHVPWPRWERVVVGLSHLLPVAMVLVPMMGALIYAALNVYSKPLPSGDGLTNTMEIRQVAESGRLPEYFTYLIINATPESRQHRGIDYPTTFYVSESFYWMLGGERALFLSTVLAGAATVLFGYLIFRRAHPLIAGLAAAMALLMPFNRFTQVPLMEPPLLAVMLAAIYFYGRLLDAPGEQKWKYAVLTGAMLGLGVALKQQGWILAAALALHSVVTYVVTRRRSRQVSFRTLLLIAAVAVVALAIPVADLTARNGTILGSEFGLFSNITRNLPFMQSKYQFDPEAQVYLISTQGYGVQYLSHWQVVKEFLTYPLNQGLAGPGVTQSVWIYLTLILLGVALLYSTARRWAIWPALLVVLGAEVMVTKQFNDLIINYHLLGIAVTTLLLIVGGIGLYHWLSSTRLRNSVPLVVALLVAFSFVSLVWWTQRNHGLSWGEARSWENRATIAEYKDLGAFMDRQIPRDALVFAGGVLFPYFGRREVIATTWWGGAKLPYVWQAASGEEAAKYLRPYGIDYVFLDRVQLALYGTGSWVPTKGLVESIDSSASFQRVYRSPAGQLSLYKVLYPSETPAH